jgi:phosphatidylglycerophosphatase A
MLYWGRMNNTAMIKIFATWFGLGRAPKAPGTFGTVGAIPLVYLFSRFGEFQYMFATLAFTVAAIMVAHIYELTIADEHDSPEFVMDEVAGFLVTMTWVPFTWQYVLAGFILFRVLDALKPWPISVVDAKVPGGIGAVADDLVAGILANIALQMVLAYGGFPF